jgi:hydrogenase nickel incorporation protein HypA/HybF
VSVHELSMCDAIARAVDVHAGGRPVQSVTVRIGHLRQVVPDTLEFSWSMVTKSTALEGAELQVEYVPAVVTCEACGATTTLDAPVLACAACGARAVTLTSGDELLIASLQLAPAEMVSGERD